MNVNRVFLAGNLTRDPELRVTPSGTAICKFGLAVNKKWRDQAGNAQEKTLFVDCTAWGKTGENLNKYVGRGDPLFLEGELELEQWEDKTTQQKRSKISVNVTTFQLMPRGDKPQGEQEPERPATPPPRSFGGGRPAPAPRNDINDEDVPF